MPPVDVTAPGVFVGRDRELGELDAGLAEAFAGRGGLVLLVGDPGIGKTRLADEFCARAHARGALSFWGRCWEGGGAPAYWPWVQVVRSYLRHADPASLDAELGSGATYIAQIVPELREAIPGMQAVPGLDAEHVRFALFDAVSAFLQRAAIQKPLIVVLDDLHAADPPSLLLLQFMARELRGSRLLILGSFRDAEPGISPAVAALLGGLARDGRRLPLRGLGEEAVAALVAGACQQVPNATLAKTIHRTTDGNPFFVDEVLRLLRAEDRLDERHPERRPLGIPGGVRDAIGQRIALLSTETRQVLTVAAVIGRDFDARVVEHSAVLATEDVLAALDEAMAARVVSEALRTARRYSFCHALVRETLYEALPAGTRARLHHEVGEALERLHGDAADDHVAELAHHFFEAAAVGGAQKALELSQRAGDRARDMLAFEEGRGHYDRALQSMELAGVTDSARRCELLLRRAQCESGAGESAAARASFQEAAAIARRIGAAELLGRAAIGYARGIGGFLHVVRADETIIALIEEALAALEERDSALRSRLLARFAVELYYTEHVDRRIGLSREAIEMARRLQDPASLLIALYSRHWAACGPETLAERLANAGEIVALAGELRDTEMTFLGHHLRVGCLLELCDAEPVDREIQAMSELADAARQPFYRWRTTCLRATRAIMDARFDEAERLADEALDIGRRSDPEIAAVVRDNAHAFALRFGQGRLDELEPAVLDFTRRYPWIQPWRLPLIYAELGRIPDARAELERQAAGGFLDFPRDALWISRVAALAHACALVGDVGRAQELYELLLPFEDRNVSTIADQSYGPVATRLGILATVMERWDDAERHFLAAHANCRTLRAPTFTALTLSEHARMLLTRGREGDRNRALALLDEALRLCTTHGIGAILDRVTADLARARNPAQPAHRFRQEGEYWNIVFETDGFRMKDGKGLRYIAQLIANAGTEVHALDLVASTSSRPGAEDTVPEGLRVTRSAGAGPALDAEAKAAYRRRLEELDTDIAEARAFNDPERVAALTEEKDFLMEELRAAVGLGGRDRQAASQSERARVNVTRSIRSSIARIADSSPALADHLTESIRTGTFCAYLPGRNGRRDWHL